eukprot:TRINITY_DN1027_c0_g1_i3.p1 TRINITY_DN1027_c0_g1~~TRINITY_DN1027_c0_g1_i3.p1  ORF type:complete len:203 (+),score=21.84 TRINITY_DN1027_c0_g1_i3:465-1073(+)
MSSVGRLVTRSTTLLVCDIQERFRPLIQNFPAVVHSSKTLISCAKELQIPIIATEQYSKGLGTTVPELDIRAQTNHVFEKKQFSMLTPEVRDVLFGSGRTPKSVVLVGIEAHVCVQQTALDLREHGIDVHIVADGVSSQRLSDRIMAIERMRQSGVFVTTTESAVFELMRSADHSSFKTLSMLFHNWPPECGLPPVSPAPNS